MRDLRQFWSPRRIGEDRVSLARLGPLRLWLARAEKEWGFACEYGEVGEILDIAQVPEDVVPANLDWITTVFSEAPREFHLKPAVPDRAVVVKPPYPVLIPPGESGTFHALVPVFITVVVSSGRKEMDLATFPSRQLSDTWFGAPTEGEFCYSLPFNAERDLGELKPLPNHLVCPIEIQNRSGLGLKFEKLCFRPEYVGIYCGDRNLWCTPVRIQHDDSFKGTTIRYGSMPRDAEAGMMQLASPRKREEKVFSRLTFSSGFSRDIIFGK